MSWNLLRSVGSLLGQGTHLGTMAFNVARNQQISRPLSTLFRSSSPLFKSWNDLQPNSRLELQPAYSAAMIPRMSPSVSLVPVRGMKVKASLQRRCKDCYLIYIKGVLHNLCRTHGRHKARQRPPYFSTQRIISGVSMAIKKPW